MYDANTLVLLHKFNKHADLIKALKTSYKSIVKYKDTGEVFRGKYIISSTELNNDNSDNSDTPLL